MKLLLTATFLAATLSTAFAGGPAPKWVDGSVTYKYPGIDTHFPVAADACKAGVDDLAKHGNKKTFVDVKDGTSTTMLTCVLKESDGTPFEQTNVLTKILECPDTTTAKSTDNSGDFAKIRCQCDAKKGCPKPAKK